MAAQCGNDERSKVTRNLETSMTNLALIVLALLFFPCSLPAQGVTRESNTATGRTRSSENQGQGVNAEINASTKLAYEGGTLPLTTTPVVGTPNRKYNPTFQAGTEPLDPNEIRVTILGSGDPFVKSGQASASVLARRKSLGLSPTLSIWRQRMPGTRHP